MDKEDYIKLYKRTLQDNIEDCQELSEKMLGVIAKLCSILAAKGILKEEEIGEIINAFNKTF